MVSLPSTAIGGRPSHYASGEFFSQSSTGAGVYVYKDYIVDKTIVGNYTNMPNYKGYVSKPSGSHDGVPKLIQRPAEEVKYIHHYLVGISFF